VTKALQSRDPRAENFVRHRPVLAERGSGMKARLLRLGVALVSLVALVAALGAGWKWG